VGKKVPLFFVKMFEKFLGSLFFGGGEEIFLRELD